MESVWVIKRWFGVLSGTLWVGCHGMGQGPPPPETATPHGRIQPGLSPGPGLVPTAGAEPPPRDTEPFSPGMDTGLVSRVFNRNRRRWGRAPYKSWLQESGIA